MRDSRQTRYGSRKSSSYPAALVVVALLAGLAIAAAGVSADDAAPVARAARAVAVGTSWQVNSYTTGSQRASHVGLSLDGTFTIAWGSFDLSGGPSQDGDGAGVLAQRYDWAVNPLGNTFQVNQAIAGDQFATEVVQVEFSGSIKLGITFESTEFGGFNKDMYLRLYTDGLEDSPGDILANLTTAGNQNGGNLFFTENGLALHGGVVWEGQTANQTDVLYRVGVYGAGGPYGNLRLGDDAGKAVQPGTGARQVVGDEFQINTYATGYQGRPSACGQGNGDFVVVWASFGQDASPSSIFGRRANVDTGPIGTEFTVNTHAAAAQDYPHVCCSDSGFVVTWRNNAYPVAVDGDGTSLSARRFDPSGSGLGTEFLVHQGTAGGQYGGRLGCDPAGNFIVSWQNAFSTNDGVFARAFDTAGAPLTDDSPLDAAGFEPSIAMTTAGRAVATWTRAVTGAPPNDQFEIFAQQLSVPGLGGVTTTTMAAGGVCGDPVDPPSQGALVSGARAISATDALFVLQAAVSAVSCADCVCDVNGLGGVTATDALIVLQVGVGQQIPLQCPPCS